MVSLPHNIQTLIQRARQSFYDEDHNLMSGLLEEAWTTAVTENDPGVCFRIAHTVSDLFNRTGKQDRALKMAFLAVEHKRSEGSIDYQLANYLCFLAKLLGDMGRAPEAVPHAKEGVRLFAKLFGDEHYETRITRGCFINFRPRQRQVDRNRRSNRG